MNVALGGARADSGPNSNGPIPGVPKQIAAYESFSAAYGQVPFKPTDLVTFQAGPNDIFQGFQAAFPLAPTPGKLQNLAVTFGLAAAANVNIDTQQLLAGGARTILLANIPNIGVTPSYQALEKLFPGAAAAGLTAVTTFNNALNQDVQTLAANAPQANIVQMDLFGLNKVIQGNPLAFGIVNTTDQCVGNPNCNQTTAQGFAFWDGVHPTAAIHQLWAQYGALLLSTEQTGKAVGALGQVSLSNRLEGSDIIFRRSVSPLGETRNGLYAEVIGSTASFDGTSTRLLGNSSYDYDLGGVRAGFDASDGALAIGASIAYQTGNLSGRQLHSDIETTAVDTYALLRFSPFFVGVEGGFSKNNYDNIKRDTGFPTVHGESSTSGVDSTVAATIGSQFQRGGITLTPAARVGYASVGIDAFQESAPVLALQYGDRDITTGFWTVRVRAATPLSQFGRANIYGEAGYEDLFSTDNLYSAKLVNNTAHAMNISDDLEGRGFFLKAGVAGYLTQNIKVTGEYGLSLQNGAGDVHTGRLRLTIPLGGNELALPE